MSDGLDVNTASSATAFATANPVGGTLYAAASIFSYISAKQRGKEEARWLREEADYAFKEAETKAKQAVTDMEFEQAEQYGDIAATGLASGKESYAPGTAIGRLMEANKLQAEELANDLLDRGRQQKERLKSRADQAEKSHRKGSLTGAALGVIDIF